MNATRAVFVLGVLFVLQASVSSSGHAIEVDVSDVAMESEVRFDTSQAGKVTVKWPTGADSVGEVTFRLAVDAPLIESMALRSKSNDGPVIVARDLHPFTAITVGTRNLDTPAGWTMFFDKVHQRPYERFAAVLEMKSVRANTNGSRGMVAFGPLSAGSFSGELAFTFYAGSPLIQAEAVVSTEEDRRAIIYDAGLVTAANGLRRYVWSDHSDVAQSSDSSASLRGSPKQCDIELWLAKRTMAAASRCSRLHIGSCIRSILPTISASIGWGEIIRRRHAATVGEFGNRLKVTSDLCLG